jgi:hypothetical protein
MNADRLRPLSFVLALAGASLALARPAGAAEPTMSECLKANESAIALRGERKLRGARDSAVVCAASSCPGQVRDACQNRLRALSAAIPTVVFLAHDSAGHDLVAVHVSMDGAALTDRLDGSAIEVDPGQHTFRFEAAGQPPVEKPIVIGEGEKDRRETVVLGEPGPVPPPPGPTPERIGPKATPGAGQRLAGIVIGATGLAGLALGGIAGGVALANWSKAKNYCSGMTVACTTNPNSPGVHDENAANTMATLSTVSFIAGGVLAAAGVVVALTAPRATAESPKPSALEIVPTAGPGGAALTLLGTF